MLKSMKEDTMINSIKRSREVEKNKQRSGARVRGHKEVTGHSEEGCLCAILRAKTRLIFIIQTFGTEMGMELGGNHFF